MKNNREYNFTGGWLSGFTQSSSLSLIRRYNSTLVQSGAKSISSLQNEVLIGLLLGDLFVQKRTANANSSLQFKQGMINKDYLFHLYDIFKELCKMEAKVTSFVDKRSNKTYSYALFNTQSLECLNYYRNLFYHNGVKIVPGNIGDLLTPASLAYWAMDDGYADRKGFMFCTDSFLKDEVILLTQILQDKFKLDCSVREIIPGRCRIYIKFKSMATFRALVDPYFHPSMMYKINGCKRSTTEGGLSKPLSPPKKNFTGGWLSGFTQASGSFTVVFDKRKSGLCIRPKPIFTITQHISELELFKKMQQHFGMGFITQNKGNQSVSFLVTSFPLNFGKAGFVRPYGLEFTRNIHLTRSLSSSPIAVSGKETQLLPNFVTGLYDAEGSFMISIRKIKNKWRVQAFCKIGFHTRDLPLIISLQEYFGGTGYRTTDHKRKIVQYHISTIEDIVNIVIPHFQKYPLQTEKFVDYDLWEQCIKIIKDKDHLTEEGMNKIVSLKSALNLGLTDELKAGFANVEKMSRPIHKENHSPLDPDWVSGFTEGDGSFFFSVSTQTGQVLASYKIHIHSRDAFVLSRIKDFFGSIGGKLFFSSHQDMVSYRVTAIKDLINVIIPHFEKYELKGDKLSSYLIWKEVVRLIESKAHLTPDGKITIKGLKGR